MVDDFALPDIRTRYRERAVCPGGMVSTAVAQAARLGCRAQLISMVGDDAEGRLVARELRRCGVSTRRLVHSPRFPTSVALVLVDRKSGDRRFVVVDRREIERGAPPFDLSPVDRGAVLLIDGHFPAQALRAVKRARERGAAVVADLNAPRPAYLKLLPYVDYPIVPLEFLRAWGISDPAEGLRALRDRFGGAPVVTLGHRGALALLGDRVRRIPARRVRVRDTTGAGDVFHGAFAAGLCHGRDVLGALDLAARAAAASCTALGGMGRLMTQSEMGALE